ncbi:MAG: TlpA disulfide reductase family protein [Acidimicrobiales bacterium]
MPDSSRLPLHVIALSTVLALAAATGTYVVLSDDDTPAPRADSVALTPENPEGATFTTFDGDTVALSELRGTPLLVNFFASTCVPCITEMPDLEAVYQEVGSQMGFLGLALQDRPEDARSLVTRTGVTYQTALDKDASVITALGGTALPTTVLLDAEGTIVAVHTGKIEAAALRSLLAAKLGITT